MAGENSEFLLNNTLPENICSTILEIHNIYVEEYMCSTTGLCILQFTYDCLVSFLLSIW